MRWRREVDPRVAEVLAGASDERLLAWGELVDGQVVVCTTWQSTCPRTAVSPGIWWSRGAWSEEFLDLVVQAAPGAATSSFGYGSTSRARSPRCSRNACSGRWWPRPAELIHPDGSTGWAMLNARRSPATGEVRWAVVFDPALDPRDPGWRAAADAALVDLRGQLGV